MKLKFWFCTVLVLYSAGFVQCWSNGMVDLERMVTVGEWKTHAIWPLYHISDFDVNLSQSIFPLCALLSAKFKPMIVEVAAIVEGFVSSHRPGALPRTREFFNSKIFCEQTRVGRKALLQSFGGPFMGFP